MILDIKECSHLINKAYIVYYCKCKGIGDVS